MMRTPKTPTELPAPEINQKPGQVILRALIRWWDDLINQAIISIVLLVCWLTVVLGPPATFGLFYISSELARGESQGLKGLVEGARRNFMKSWLWMLANLFVLATIYANFVFYGKLAWGYAWLVQNFILVVGVLWIGVQLYAIPYFMYQEQPSLWLAWRNALFTFLASPGYSLLIWLVAVIVTVLSIVTVIPTLFGAPGLISLLGCEAIHERIGTYQAAMKKKQE